MVSPDSASFTRVLPSPLVSTLAVAFIGVGSDGITHAEFVAADFHGGGFWNPGADQIPNGRPSQVVNAEPFVSRVPLLSGHFDFTSQPD